MGQPLWVVDLDEVYKTLETTHRRALPGVVSVSKEGVPYGGAVGPCEGPQLAVVQVSDSHDSREKLDGTGLIPTIRSSGARMNSFKGRGPVDKRFK